MLPLIIGLIVFFAIHLVPTNPGLRQGMVDRFGAGAYKGIFALLSAVGLALIVIGYHKLQVHPGKNPGPWWGADGPQRHVAMGLMLVSMILLAAAYVPSRIRTAVKHPMLAATKLWALAHLLVNGDLGSIVLFGSFLAYAIYDRISVKRRGAMGPLGAKTGGLMGDVTAVLLGLALYAFMAFYGHSALIGVPVMPAASFAP